MLKPGLPGKLLGIQKNQRSRQKCYFLTTLSVKKGKICSHQSFQLAGSLEYL